MLRIVYKLLCGFWDSFSFRTSKSTYTAMNKTLPSKEDAGAVLGGSPVRPSLDCSHEELVAYIRSMTGGERVQEMGRSGMQGMKGTVEIQNNSVCIRWDRHEYADGAGVMVTSFTGGARIIEANVIYSHFFVDIQIKRNKRVD